MSTALHPSLARLYRCNSHDEFLYFDETYTASEDPFHSQSFYALTAVQFRFDQLETIRADLEKIVGSRYFHSTEALESSSGKETFKNLVRYFAQHEDPSFITCNINLGHGDNLEDARRECLKKIVEKYAPGVPDLKGLIFEARREHKDNNRDRSFLKHLRQEGLLNPQLGTAWVSPSDERLLWAPDVICMAYRRTLTHKDETAQYFSDLESTTQVYEF